MKKEINTLKKLKKVFQKNIENQQKYSCPSRQKFEIGFQTAMEIALDQIDLEITILKMG